MLFANCDYYWEWLLCEGLVAILHEGKVLRVMCFLSADDGCCDWMIAANATLKVYNPHELRIHTVYLHFPPSFPFLPLPYTNPLPSPPLPSPSPLSPFPSPPTLPLPPLSTPSHPRLQLHPMPPANLLPQHPIHQPMLLDHAQASEMRRGDVDGVHAAAAAGDVLDLDRVER